MSSARVPELPERQVPARGIASNPWYGASTGLFMPTAVGLRRTVTRRPAPATSSGPFQVRGHRDQEVLGNEVGILGLLDPMPESSDKRLEAPDHRRYHVDVGAPPFVELRDTGVPAHNGGAPIG